MGNYPLEHVEQVTFVNEFEKAYPLVRLFAIPNGGFRHKATAEKLKAEGVKKGVPDLYIPAWRLWVEMKRVKGSRLEKEQKDWHQYLNDLGDLVIIGYGWEDAMNKVRDLVIRNDLI